MRERDAGGEQAFCEPRPRCSETVEPSPTDPSNWRGPGHLEMMNPSIIPS